MQEQLHDFYQKSSPLNITLIEMNLQTCTKASHFRSVLHEWLLAVILRYTWWVESLHRPCGKKVNKSKQVASSKWLRSFKLLKYDCSSRSLFLTDLMPFLFLDVSSKRGKSSINEHRNPFAPPACLRALDTPLLYHCSFAPRPTPHSRRHPPSEVRVVNQ